jgi:hypothetical protein
MTKPLALLLLAVLPLAAQNTLGQAAQSGSTIDLSAATITKPFTIVSGTPSGSCSTPNAFEWSTATPTLYVCYSGTWHPYNSGGGGSMVYPGAGVANSNGTAWLTSYQVGTAANNLVQLNGSAQIPAVSGALLTGITNTQISGLGTASTQNTGTGGANLCLLNASCTFSGVNAYGTPASITLTNATGLPISTGVSGLATGVSTFLGTPSSANLLAALTTKTGTGNAVFSISPVFTTPNMGTPSVLVLTNATGLPISGITGLGTGVPTALTAAVSGTGGFCLSSGSICAAAGAVAWSGNGSSVGSSAAANFVGSSGVAITSSFPGSVATFTFANDGTLETTVGAIASGCTPLVATGSSSGTLVASLTPFMAYTNGQCFSVQISDGANHGSDTFNVASVGPVAVKEVVSGSIVAASAGDMLQNVPYLFRYTNTLSPAAFIFTK